MKDHVCCSFCEWQGRVDIGVEICPKCGTEGSLAWADEDCPEVDDRDDTPFEFNEESLDTWAERYDELNGAPEGYWDQ